MDGERERERVSYAPGFVTIYRKNLHSSREGQKIYVVCDNNSDILIILFLINYLSVWLSSFIFPLVLINAPCFFLGRKPFLQKILCGESNFKSSI